MKEQNNYAVCAGLPIEPIYQKLQSEGKCALTFLWNMQSDIQSGVYGYDFDVLRKDNQLLKNFFEWNFRAINSEIEELWDALQGHSENFKSGSFWKPWRSDHKLVMNKSFEKLTRDDKYEIFFELIDILHFYFNLCISLGLTPELITNIYAAKNLHNRERQNNGY